MLYRIINLSGYGFRVNKKTKYSLQDLETHLKLEAWNCFYPISVSGAQESCLIFFYLFITKEHD